MKNPSWDTVNYWFYIALAVFNVWMSWNASETSRLYLLFTAAYLIIHAHGHRILAAVRERPTETAPPT